MTIHENIKLKIIATPKNMTKNIILAKSIIPVFVGKNGGFNYVCGFCKIILAEDVKKGEIKNNIVRSHECWKYNEFR
jgi:hypothetical protein